jgi:hypothetical protein
MLDLSSHAAARPGGQPGNALTGSDPQPNLIRTRVSAGPAPCIAGKETAIELTDVATVSSGVIGLEPVPISFVNRE